LAKSYFEFIANSYKIQKYFASEKEIKTSELKRDFFLNFLKNIFRTEMRLENNTFHNYNVILITFFIMTNNDVVQKNL